MKPRMQKQSILRSYADHESLGGGRGLRLRNTETAHGYEGGVLDLLW